MREIILIGYFLLAAVTGAQCERVFLAAPNVFRLNNEETVFVVCKSAEKDVEIFLNHDTDPGGKISPVKKSFLPDVPQVLKLKVTAAGIPKSWDGTSLYLNLVVKLTGFQKSTKVLLDFKSGYVFIQTDKPIYTPKQDVRFRIIPVGVDLKTREGKILVDVKNPAGIRVRRIRYRDTKSKGFTSEILRLGEYSMLGTWSITASYGHQGVLNTTVTFVVKEYVLPKFSVKILSPPYLSERNSSINFEVVARYTYGKNVKGTLFIRVGVLWQKKYYSFYNSRNGIDGKEYFAVDSDLIRGIKEIPSFPFGARLNIDANVTERATGTMEKGQDMSIHVVECPFKFNFQRSSLYYKPSLPFELLFDVQFPNKMPVPFLRMSVKGTVGPDKVDFPDEDSNIVRTNRLGQAQFKLNTPPQPKGDKIMKLKIKTLHADQTNTEIEITVQCYQSPSKSYILVSGPSLQPNIGSNVDISAYVPIGIKGVQRLFYMLISRGTIVHQGVIQRELGTVTSIRLKVLAAMSPRCRIVVYYVRGNEVVADSISFKVEQEFRNKISLRSDKESYNPANDVMLTVKTDPTSHIALFGVDQSVYLLRNETSLTREKVFSVMEGFDLGCANGGGLNNQDVFKRAGLAVITDAALETKKRESRQCPLQPIKKRRRRSLDNKGKGHFLRSCCKQIKCCKNVEGIDAGKTCEEWKDLVSGSLECTARFYECCKRIRHRGRSLFQVSENDLIGTADEIDENSQELHLRNHFPEVLIWEDHNMNGKKEMEVLLTMPDTITTWVVSALSVSNETGFSITPPIRLLNAKDFFLEIKMPYSAQRLEQVTIYAVLFNYNRNAMRVNVYLKGHFSFCSSAKPGKLSERTSVIVKGNDALAVPYTIVPLEIGESIIEFVAFTQSSTDYVEKRLLVLPEGLRKTETVSVVLDPQGILEDRNGSKAREDRRGSDRQSNTFELDIPEDFIDGSQKAMLYVTGSVMGTVASDIIEGSIEKQIQLPTGCGEQTVIKLAPLVYTLRYLEKVREGLNDEIEQKSYRYMRSGYNQLMKFKKFDGSFSAWGNKRAGSTWLTAFVVKVLCQASQFIKDDIDEDVICEAMQFLVEGQREDGAFPEKFAVIHKEMIGGISGDIAMTAFVVIALLECKGSCKDIKKGSVELAVRYLEDRLDAIKKPYVLSLVTYALVLANSERKKIANQRLKTFMHSQNVKGKRVYFWKQGEQERTALNIEINAYALLSQLMLNDVDVAGPIVTWITQQRNARGSFFSTQDTCIALQALSEYSIKTAGGLLDLQLKIKLEKNNNLLPKFKVMRDNALVRQQVEISSAIGGKVFVDTTGKGTAQLQVVTEYNIPDTKNELCAYILTAETVELEVNQVLNSVPVHKKKKRKKKKCKKRRRKGKKKSNRKKCKKNKSKNKRKRQKDATFPNELTIRVCVKDKTGDSSGMAIIDVGLLTGFEADVDSVKLLMKNNSKFKVNDYELSDRHVILHVEKIPNRKTVCVEVITRRIFTVGEVQPVPVKVYDYYEPDHACTTFYGPKKGSGLLHTICEDDGECECGQGGCAQCTGHKSELALKRFGCLKADFVFRGVVTEIETLHSWVRIDVKVKQVGKIGKSNHRKGGKLSLFHLKICECPDLKRNGDYLFMVKDGLKYVINSESLVYPWSKDKKESDKLKNTLDSIGKGFDCDMFDA